MSEGEEHQEVTISTFDYTKIQPFHSLLIVENEPERATAFINRILRTVSSHHFQGKGFEQGEIFVSSASPGNNSAFRYPKKVQTYEKKKFPSHLQDIYQRQGFPFTFTSDSSNVQTLPLHFLPKPLLSMHPLLQHLNDKQFLQINKLLRIPRSFLVLHHCFEKTFPKNEYLFKMLIQHSIHQRLLLIVSCPSALSIPKDVCEQFDWIFYFEHELETQWKRWYRIAFQPFFKSAKMFVHFMRMTKKTQGLVVWNPYEYKEVGTQTRVRHSLDPLTDQQTVQTCCISIVKRLKLVARKTSIHQFSSYA